MRCLIFGTCYVDNEAKSDLLWHWIHINEEVNIDCDLLVVDSSSPHPLPSELNVLQLSDNIGHLARSGRDGWGRAFCAGLDYAVTHDYTYVAHVECDSLFRLPVRPVFHQMREEQAHVASVPVRGTRRLEVDWVETGLMMFNVDYVRRHELTKRYDWRNVNTKNKYPHLPEWYVHQMVRHHLRYMPWSAERGDLKQITVDNVGNYDWITHVSPEVADAFAKSVLQ